MHELLELLESMSSNNEISENAYLKISMSLAKCRLEHSKALEVKAELHRMDSENWRKTADELYKLLLAARQN